MSELRAILSRNIKLFFHDKGMFFTSLITPLILLVLYITFLGSVYRDSFTSGLPEGMRISDEILNGLVGGQLLSSLLAVCCVTVSFCSNMVMVQDKVTGAGRDLTTSPLRPSILSIGYYLATVISTLAICLVAAAIGFVYIASIGWYLSLADVLLLLLDILLLVLFGTAFSSVIYFFLSSQGQMSAVGSIVSSCYGFLCGAYMPISQFSPMLQKALAFLPGTYGTVLTRYHAMNGALAAMEKSGIPAEVVKELGDIVDCNLYFFSEQVSRGAMYMVLGGTTLVLMGIYIALQYRASRNVIG